MADVGLIRDSGVRSSSGYHYASPWYIRGTIHGVENDPMDGGSRYGIQPPNVSGLSAFVVQFTSADYTGQLNRLFSV